MRLQESMCLADGREDVGGLEGLKSPFKVRAALGTARKFSAFLQHNECGRDQIIKSGHIQGQWWGCRVLNNVGASVYNIRPFQDALPVL